MKTFNINSFIRSNIKSMKPYSSARDEFQDFEREMIFLDANENPFNTGLNRYPDPQQKKLKELLAKQKNVKTSQILIGNGSDEVLDLVFRAFCEPNSDNVISLPPTYGMYSVLANLNAIENREVLLTNDFQPNTQQILETVDNNTKIIFLCSPNNPTGNCFTDENITFLLENFDGLVVLDEAYIDFAERISWLQKLNKYPNLIISQTLSKAYGLAGLRVGLLYASEEIIQVLNKIKPPYNINTLSQEKAISILQNKDILKSISTLFTEEKNKLIQQLLKFEFVKEIYPSDANFILIKVDEAKKRHQELVTKNIVVRDRSNQPLCENCLRISIGTPEENKIVLETLMNL
ncbi:histidinol-phosphate transaminase [Flavobacterium sp. NRK F10]|uniref:histidinol-phosphate transaminase n=1 Tax=Flavobacterium sp. NRK F10 TaxID=2954931 RepID=UPI0020905A4A|nr:histidinol-phosphate transaminase [Flavobacterium sp. NRK F10]MCO6176305.1 histidinol-phosphate transaminase [Flavobacterium sp. NRK F10]